MHQLRETASGGRVHRVLVIDDNEAIHDDYRKILCPSEAASFELESLSASLFGNVEGSKSSLNYEIDHAYQGCEGLEKVKVAVQAGRPYSMAFVDMRMPPGWDGVETICHLWEVDPSMQIVICTAYSDCEWTQVIEKLGTTDRLLVLKKTFDCIEVTQMATALCEKRRLLHMAEEQTEVLESEIESRTAQLRQLAESDPLTKLPNRLVFYQLVQRSIDLRAHDPDAFDVVMLLDIDNFKLVNDTLGHHAGDKLLLEVSDRIRGCVCQFQDCTSGPNCVLARLGGDEFAILANSLKCLDDARKIADSILAAMNHPFVLDGRKLNIGVSIGMAKVECAKQDATELLRNSDIAMYESKAAGKNRLSVYDEKMHEDLLARVEFESDMRDALKQNRFELYWQPIVDLDTTRICGQEALLRWHDPDGRLRSPNDFIFTAEVSGFIVPLGEWVIEEAIRTIASRTDYFDDVYRKTINVNITRRQLVEPDFVDIVERLLRKYQVDGRFLNFEVTESTVMHDPDGMANTLHALRELGGRVYLDDFGTGYSSL
ncbi:MAG: diguanylate cyclase, partial [Planctomycetales bacterium]|nr:diguanylate cyclase [Planctomycetales bacterium]